MTKSAACAALLFLRKRTLSVPRAFFQEGLLRGQVCMEQAGEDNPQGKQGQEDGGAGYGVAGDGSHHCTGEKEQQNLKVSQELFPMGRVSSTQTPELMGSPTPI